MKALFLFTVILSLTASLSAQPLFPDRCTGIWEGTMYLWNGGQVKDSLPVRMTIIKQKDSAVWSWKTEYLSPTRPMTKDYLLKLSDPAKRVYITDEGDGILLYDYEFGNKLYSAFAVQGAYLTACYEIKGEELVFEVSSGKQLEAVTNGVTSYSVNNLQRVVYHRKR